MMRGLHTPVRAIRRRVFKEVAQLGFKADADTLLADMEAIPVELVTGSGSGLDPHISPAAAEYQVPRIAEAKGISEEEVREVIDKYTKGKFLGILGEETVNVLEVNLALDGILTD